MLLRKGTGIAFATPIVVDQPTATYAPPIGYGILSAPGVSPAVYGYSSAMTNWNVGQWGTDGSLGHFGPAAGSTAKRAVFGSVGLSARLELTTGSAQSPATMAFRQGGAVLPCLAAGAPNEFDLLAQPNSSAQGPRSENASMVAAHPAMAPLLTVADMSSLTSSGIYRTVATSVAKSALVCDVNQATSYVSVVFTDTAVAPAQVFFYQLNFNRICEPGGNYDICMNTVGRYFFFNGVPLPGGAPLLEWGMDDQLTSYGLPMIADLQRHDLKLDLLPQIKGVLQSPSNRMDHDLGHWRLSGFYLGQHIWGDVNLSTEFTGFVPMVTGTIPG